MLRRGQPLAEQLKRDRAELVRASREKRDPRIELRERLREAIALTDEGIAQRIRKAGVY